MGCAVSARAFTIELNDVAPYRIERQREATLGNLPLPETPNISRFTERLKEQGLELGNDVFVRIFKEQSELEVWMKKGDRFVLFATYPVCYWSGTLGPKIAEGDKQSPEGVYQVTRRQLHFSGRHPRAFSLGFPNTLDRHHQRNGTYLLVHGECSSVGCYAMTNAVIEEIFKLTQAALNNRQAAVQVHIFPFRPTEPNFARHGQSQWTGFWRNLQTAHDSFERTRLPPKVSVCDGRYWVEDGKAEPSVEVSGAVRRLRQLAADRGLEKTEACKAPMTPVARAPTATPVTAQAVVKPEPPVPTPSVVSTAALPVAPARPIEVEPTEPPVREGALREPRIDDQASIVRPRVSERLIVERPERTTRIEQFDRVERVGSTRTNRVEVDEPPTRSTPTRIQRTERLETPAPRRVKSITISNERSVPVPRTRRASTPSEPGYRAIKDMDFEGRK